MTPTSPASREPEPRPLTPPRAAGLMIATAALIGLLGWKNPLTVITNATAGEQFTAMQPARRDPARHDVDFKSLLPEVRPSEKLILFVGTSQQYSCSLPKGAAPVPNHEATVTSDLFVRMLSARGKTYEAYNVGAPNQTLVEVLWRSVRWFKVDRPPDVLILQLAFDAFRKVGIRPQFEELLSDPRFFAEVTGFERTRSASYLGQFTTARREYEQRKAELSSEDSIESRLRRGLDRVPLYHEREARRADLFNILYNARVKLLGITPTTRRHITGPPLTSNLDALREILSIARSSGARVFLYNAPVNPNLDMFYEDEYRFAIEQVVALSAEFSASYLDLSRAVPSSQWGYWINGPDPIHVTEEGHATIAQRLDEAWGQLL